MHYALINSENLVVNVIVWDGVSNWSPPEGHYVICIDGLDVGIGYKYINEQFVENNS
jgi:hypothetical protein